MKCAANFQYLGSWVDDAKADMEIRIAKAWTALKRMKRVWNSNLGKELKIRFFKATVESVLLYGSECWTLTNTLSKRLDGVYTRMLRAVINITWRDRLTNEQLYGRLPKVSQTVCQRRLRFSGHCWRSKNEMVQKVLLWEPMHGYRKPGRPPTTYIDLLEKDTSIRRNELPTVMEDRNVWRAIVHDVRASTNG